MAISEELEVLKEVVRRLDRAKILSMLTGSIAANFYTVPRMTRDIDIVVELSSRDIDRFSPLFERFRRPQGQPIPSQGILQEEKGFCRRSGSLRCSAGRLDSIKA
jgi:hypothetical protein